MLNKLLDTFCCQADQALKTLFAKSEAYRSSPAKTVPDLCLNTEEKKLAGRLMRINHSGEVCAQALYAGQSLTAKLPTVRKQMENAAREETDHLVWCEERLQELNSHTSFLNPALYAGSWLIGAVSGAISDRWSLGFVAETEKQVVKHLESHLEKLPAADLRSQAVIKQMHSDEEQHRYMALKAGAASFPTPVKLIMQITAKVMTKTTYWL